MFLCYYVAWPCDLDLWPFDLESFNTVLLMPDPHTNFYYPTITGYWVMKYWIWSHFRLQALSLRMRRVTWPIIWGQKWSTFLKSLTQIYLFTLSLSGRYDKDSAMLYAKNSIYPICRLQSSLRMRSITWPVHRGSPKTTRNNFRPRLIYSLYNFYGATTTIKGTFILEHPHVKVIFGRSSQNRSQKWRFFGNLRV